VKLADRTAEAVKAVSDERADLILNMLRAIRGKQDQHDQKFDEVITRLSALERDFAGMKLDFAGVHARLDNIGRRLTGYEPFRVAAGGFLELKKTRGRMAGDDRPWLISRQPARSGSRCPSA
jgi:hypothetical protein